MPDDQEPELPVITAIHNAYQKQMPNESVYKHLSMIENYLRAQAEGDKVVRRKKARLTIADKLKLIKGSQAMQALLDYCE